MTKDFATWERHLELETLAADKTKLFYYMNKLISM